jgi:repressor LexA
MKELTQRQKEVVSFVTEYINAHSYPPTIREIADYFFMSVKGAHDHVTALKKKGVLKQTDRRSRTMELVKTGGDGDGLVEIPLLGTVAAGLPILAEENRDGSIVLHGSMLKKNRKYFALKVRGDSMSGAGIMDGDTVVIEKQNTAKNGEIVVAAVDLDEAVTLKRFFRESTRIRLQAENPAYLPTYSQHVRIMGRLARVIRFY